LEIINQSIIKGCFQRESSLLLFSCYWKIAKIKWLILPRLNDGKKKWRKVQAINESSEEIIKTVVE
jgi:hypothetical protein